jgi:putative membrane protein
MRRLAIFGTALSALLLALPARADDDTGKGKADAKPASPDQFVMKASESGLAEVNLSRLAEERASDPEVKKFAQHMVQDHTKANQELLGVVNRKQLRAAQQMDRKHQELMDKLTQMRGADFDRAYMDAMVKDHEETVSLFQAASKGMDDSDLKGFASKTLPTLQEHLKMAKEVRDKAKGGGT